MQSLPQQVLEMLNTTLGGFDLAMGLRFLDVTPDKLVAELTVEQKHKQPYGIVHGGVYAAMIETVCSTGAAVNVLDEGKTAVGLENTTSFLRAVRSGRLRCTAEPQFRGRRSHVWEAKVQDDQNRLAATGRVRLIILEPGAEAAGTVVRLRS